MRMCVPILVSSALCTVLTFHVASAIASAQMGMHPASHSLQYRVTFSGAAGERNGNIRILPSAM